MKTSSRFLNVGGAILGAAALLATVTTTQAALIIYEGFDIDPPATLEGASGATSSGWTTNWDNTDNAWESTAAGLSYGPLVTSTGGGMTTGNQGNMQAYRNFASQSSGSSAAPATYWFSFLFNRSEGADNASMGLSFFNGGTENTFVGQPGVSNYGFNAPFGNINSTIPVTTGTTVFLLARYVMDGNTSGQTSLAHYWVNPDISDTVIVPSDSAAVAEFGTAFRAFGFDRIRLGSFGSRGAIDEIRLGTTFRDVAPIPEPASAMLLGAGLLTLVVRRRRA